MAWKEQVEGWSLDIQGENLLGYKIGTGERVFVESPGSYGCTTTLPEIDDEMVDPQSSTSYANILCTNINYKRTHSSGANGLTATVSYASPELSGGSAEQREEDKGAGSFSADLVTLNVQGGTTWFWYTKNAQDGATTVFPFDIVNDNGGPCAENLPIAVTQIQRTKRIRFEDDAALDAWMPKVALYGGKLNNADFLGFKKGQVLVGGITGSMNGGVWDVDVVFIIRLIGNGIEKDDWNYMPSDAGGATLFHRPVKTIAEVSPPPGPGLVTALAQSYMYGYAAIEELLETEEESSGD